MKKKLPMKGDPVPEWLLTRPRCACTRPASHNIGEDWYCEMCFQIGTEMVDLLTGPLKTRRAG